MGTPCVKLAESIIVMTKVTQHALISYYTRVNLTPNTECKEKNLNYRTSDLKLSIEVFIWPASLPSTSNSSKIEPNKSPEIKPASNLQPLHPVHSVHATPVNK